MLGIDYYNQLVVIISQITTNWL
ncbi:uncharacterized protein METZ01_LOCUS370139 [marine metagenome]|uniref:Uncharacterized protein n=1 Tax=marine metagenome TaxID=408172 RepID=A0A382T6A4_9ZZZZ